jgi:hypothetical protein
MKEAAAVICERKPTARQAVVILRRFRTGKQSPGDVLSLIVALERCLNEYLAKHPGTTWQMVRAAVQAVAGEVEEAAAEAEGD